MERILMEQPGKESFRAYLGYSGWGPGQLESEMQTGSWITLPADPSIVFEKEAARIWSDLVLSLDEMSRHYADMPFDPSSN
jgi:putative transcriptional regulator